jgi:hypothetical protein
MRNSHVGPEALAAWAEGRLSTGEANQVEAHLADCASCQEMLAVFVRTEPPPSESAFSWINWRWAVPVAAAATAAAIWVAIPDKQRSDEFERTVAPALEGPASPSANARASADSAPAAAAKSDSSSLRRDTAVAPLEDQVKQEAPAAAPKVERLEPTPTDELRERDRNLSVEAITPAAPPPPAAPAEARQAAPLAAATAAPLADVVSPDPLVRWRIVSAARLERSTDGGKTWQPITVPEAVGVTAVRVPSSLTAIVTTTDGRQFRTDDQGRTWHLVQP